jgi:hypothetical protein
MTGYSRGDGVLIGFVLPDGKRTMIDRKLGARPKTDMEAVHRELRRSLGL